MSKDEIKKIEVAGITFTSMEGLTLEDVWAETQGEEILVWDGADFRITYLETCSDTGVPYDTNDPNSVAPIYAYAILPTLNQAFEAFHDLELKILGAEE